MALSEDERNRVDKALGAFCKARVPEHARNQIRLGFRVKGHDVVLYEARPHWREPDKWMESEVAKFRLDGKTRKWRLLWRDRNLKWHYYENAGPGRNFAKLLQEVDRDPLHIFWG